MSRGPKLSLTIDDPLAPAPIAEEVAADRSLHGESNEASALGPRKNSAVVEGNPNADDPPRRRAAATRGRSARNSQRGAGGPSALQAEIDGVVSRPPLTNSWRSWTGLTRVASYRLPDELLAELAEAAADLQLPVGLLVTAAITHLLDEPGDVISKLVDQADDSRIQGRRAARRGLADIRACPTADTTASTDGGML